MNTHKQKHTHSGVWPRRTGLAWVEEDANANGLTSAPTWTSSKIQTQRHQSSIRGTSTTTTLCPPELGDILPALDLQLLVTSTGTELRLIQVKLLFLNGFLFQFQQPQPQTWCQPTAWLSGTFLQKCEPTDYVWSWSECWFLRSWCSKEFSMHPGVTGSFGNPALPGPSATRSAWNTTKPRQKQILPQPSHLNAFNIDLIDSHSAMQWDHKEEVSDDLVNWAQIETTNILLVRQFCRVFYCTPASLPIY